MNDERSFFDELKRRLDALRERPERDNEAVRHDQLIYPFLTSPFGLAWSPSDLVSQARIEVPMEVEESHVFRNAVPRERRPDILISPLDIHSHVAVVEEKAEQLDIDRLNNYRLQLTEYQALYDCTWGLLSDGDKWILKRNLHTEFRLASLEELESAVEDLRERIGKEAVLKRWRTFGRTDLVMAVPVPPHLWKPPATIAPSYAPLVIAAPTVKLMTELQEGDTDFQRLTSQQFEDVVCKILEQRGYKLYATGPQRDSGRDILAQVDLIQAGVPTTIAVEVKHRPVVTVTDIQNTLYTHRDFSTILCVNSGRFSGEVLDEAKRPEQSMHLFLNDGLSIQEWIKKYAK